MNSETPRRILLTGATGFVGSYVLRRLIEEPGAAVCGLRRAESNPWRITDIVDRVQWIDGDLANVAAVEPAIREFGPICVLHLAWAGVTNAHRNDRGQLANVYNTVQLAEAAERCGVRHFIGLGSQAEYGPQQGRLAENAPMRPTTLYGVAKLCAGLVVERLCALAEIRFAWLRLFSSYGPKDDASWMIPYLMGCLLRGERPALTAGEQRWDYVYVEDAAEAVVRVAQTPTAEGVFNVGSGRVETIRSIVEQIRDLIDPSVALGFGEVPYRPDQVMHLEADVSKLAAVTGWTPATPLAEGLRRTLAWCRAEHETRRA